MYNVKLVKILKSLSPEEFKYLRWFAQSNFFNTDANLLRLFEALSKYYPGYQSKAMTKEALFGKVFGGQAYHDGKWRNLLSKMTKLVEDYLIWLELEHQETNRQKLLTAAYGRRNLYQEFEKSTADLSEKLHKLSDTSADALRERMLVSLQLYHHPHTVKVDNRDKLQSAMEDLDYYYFSEKLRLACDLKVLENMVAGSTPILLKEEVHKLAQREYGRPLNYLKTYAKVFALLEQAPGIENFQEAFDFFSGIAGELSEPDRLFGLMHLSNVAINQVNKGEVEFRPFLFKLYKWRLEQGAMITDGKITENTFLNIVSTGAVLKEFDWVEQFILDYEKCLPEDTKAETNALSFGYLHFQQSDYSRVIDLLLNHPFQDFNKLLLSKQLLLRCYFELCWKDDSYYSLFISYANALDKFVKREKQLSATRKVWHKNLHASIVAIARHKYGHTLNKAVKTKMIQEIKSKPMYLKGWLLERLKTTK